MPVCDREVDQLLQHRRRGQVLEAAERRLAGQCLILGQSIGDQLEDRIVTQRVVIIAVFVAGENAEQPLTQHQQQRVLTLRVWDRQDIARIVRCSSTADQTAAAAAARHRKKVVPA